MASHAHGRCFEGCRFEGAQSGRRRQVSRVGTPSSRREWGDALDPGRVSHHRTRGRCCTLTGSSQSLRRSFVDMECTPSNSDRRRYLAASSTSRRPPNPTSYSISWAQPSARYKSATPNPIVRTRPQTHAEGARGRGIRACRKSDTRSGSSELQRQHRRRPLASIRAPSDSTPAHCAALSPAQAHLASARRTAVADYLVM